MNIIQRIMNSPCKYPIVALIIMVIVMGVGILCLDTTMNSIEKQHITYTDFTVVDKYISEDGNDEYMIVSDQGYTYVINHDNEGVALFNKIEKGVHYYFVVQNPHNDTDHIHIIQVYDDKY